jgi:hypothetical protein
MPVNLLLAAILHRMPHICNNTKIHRPDATKADTLDIFFMYFPNRPGPG